MTRPMPPHASGPRYVTSGDVERLVNDLMRPERVDVEQVAPGHIRIVISDVHVPRSKRDDVRRALAERFAGSGMRVNVVYRSWPYLLVEASWVLAYLATWWWVTR